MESNNNDDNIGESPFFTQCRKEISSSNDDGPKLLRIILKQIKKEVRRLEREEQALWSERRNWLR